MSETTSCRIRGPRGALINAKQVVIDPTNLDSSNSDDLQQVVQDIDARIAGAHDTAQETLKRGVPVVYGNGTVKEGSVKLTDKGWEFKFNDFIDHAGPSLIGMEFAYFGDLKPRRTFGGEDSCDDSALPPDEDTWMGQDDRIIKPGSDYSPEEWLIYQSVLADFYQNFHEDLKLEVFQTTFAEYANFGTGLVDIVQEFIDHPEHFEDETEGIDESEFTPPVGGWMDDTELTAMAASVKNDIDLALSSLDTFSNGAVIRQAVTTFLMKANESDPISQNDIDVLINALDLGISQLQNFYDMIDAARAMYVINFGRVPPKMRAVLNDDEHLFGPAGIPLLIGPIIELLNSYTVLPDAGILVPVSPTEIRQEYLPDEFLYCDGSEVSKSAYPELYQLMGDRYGLASDPDFFKLPDRRGMVAMNRCGSFTDETTDEISGDGTSSSEVRSTIFTRWCVVAKRIPNQMFPTTGFTMISGTEFKAQILNGDLVVTVDRNFRWGTPAAAAKEWVVRSQSVSGESVFRDISNGKNRSLFVFAFTGTAHMNAPYDGAGHYQHVAGPWDGSNFADTMQADLHGDSVTQIWGGGAGPYTVTIIEKP